LDRGERENSNRHTELRLSLVASRYLQGLRIGMGLYAAKSAVLVAAQLNLGNTAARLLLHMALECWDDQDNPGGRDPRRYFAGRESSAIALGFLAPDNGSEPAFRAVKRAIQELVRAGAIVRIRAARNGQTAEYELLVDSARPPLGRSSNVAILRRVRDEGASEWSPQRANF
jgi:hypothetical protein